MPTDFYSVLGVNKGISKQDLSKAYRKLARKFHPDVNKNNPQAEAKFKEISAAYEVLSDEKKRKWYDEFGDESLQAGFDEERAKLLRQFRSQGSRTRTRGGPSSGYSQADLSDFLNQSSGKGGFSDLFGDIFGFSQATQQAAPEPSVSHQTIKVPFADAINGGSVEVVLGTSRKNKTLKVTIPPGSANGSKIRLSGAKTGVGVDVVLNLEVEDHPIFKRDGNDIHLDLPVKLSELIDGASVKIPTLDGSINVKIPAGSVPGGVLRIKGKGVKTKGAEGALLAKLILVAPDRLTDEVKHMARALDSYYSGDPRRGLF